MLFIWLYFAFWLFFFVRLVDFSIIIRWQIFQNQFIGLKESKTKNNNAEKALALININGSYRTLFYRHNNSWFMTAAQTRNRNKLQYELNKNRTTTTTMNTNTSAPDHNHLKLSIKEDLNSTEWWRRNELCFFIKWWWLETRK